MGVGYHASDVTVPSVLRPRSSIYAADIVHIPPRNHFPSHHMGIPRLTALLHPYAAKTEWKRQNTPSAQDSGSKLVIDGPALAYFIYYQCLTSKSSATNALEAMPSYARLAEAVVEWLNEIERFGVTVSVHRLFSAAAVL